jgi:hypothetical protein
MILTQPFISPILAVLSVEAPILLIMCRICIFHIVSLKFKVKSLIYHPVFNVLSPHHANVEHQLGSSIIHLI